MQCQRILTAIIGCRQLPELRTCPVSSGPPRRSHSPSCQVGCRLADSLSRSRPLPEGEWTRRDLNPRPPACKAGALPAELRARTGAPSGPVVAGSASTRQFLSCDLGTKPGPHSARSARWSWGLLNPKDTPERSGTKFIGGDPSAGSPTDTLLRLNPACRIEVQTRQEACLHYDPTRMV